MRLECESLLHLSDLSPRALCAQASPFSASSNPNSMIAFMKQSASWGISASSLKHPGPDHHPPKVLHAHPSIHALTPIGLQNHIL